MMTTTRPEQIPKFHQAVVRVNGEITEIRKETARGVRRIPGGNTAVRGFRHLLENNLPEDLGGRFNRFRTPLPGSDQFELEWAQADPFSAFGAIHVDGRYSMKCYLLSGLGMFDEFWLDRMEEMLSIRLMGTGVQWKGELRSMKQRPLVACVPPDDGPTEEDRKHLSLLVAALATAFFEKVTDSAETGVL